MRATSIQKKPKLRSKPRKFQWQDLFRVEEWRGRALVAWEMGLGKTLFALLYAFRNIKGRVLVICPSVAKEVWKREADKHLGRSATILSGRNPHPIPLHQRQLVIINYDILGLPSETKQTWSNVLKKMKFELVVIDEIHAIKEQGSQRSKATKFLCEGVPHVLGLSGTPIVNRPIELFHPLSIIRPKMFPSRWEYGVRYCQLHQNRYGYWDYSGACNLRELHEVLTNPEYGCMVRRKKIDVLRQLPPKTRTTIPLELPPPARKEYNYAVQSFLKWLAERDLAAALRASRAELLTRVGYLKRLAAILKLPLTIQWIEDFLNDTNEKLIVFGIHHAVLHPLYQKFAQTSVIVDGSVQGTKRQSAIDRFNTDKNTRLFFGNLIAAGTAWSCTSSSTVAKVEFDWVPGNHAQAEARCEGIGRGTGSPTNVYYLAAKDTIEIRICEVLESKSRIAAQALDGAEKSEFNLLKAVFQDLTRKSK